MITLLKLQLSAQVSVKAAKTPLIVLLVQIIVISVQTTCVTALALRDILLVA